MSRLAASPGMRYVAPTLMLPSPSGLCNGAEACLAGRRAPERSPATVVRRYGAAHAAALRSAATGRRRDQLDRFAKRRRHPGVTAFAACTTQRSRRRQGPRRRPARRRRPRWVHRARYVVGRLGLGDPRSRRCREHGQPPRRSARQQASLLDGTPNESTR